MPREPEFSDVGQQEPCRPEAIGQFRPYLIHLVDEVIRPQVGGAAEELGGGGALEALMLRGLARLLKARAADLDPRGE